MDLRLRLKIRSFLPSFGFVVLIVLTFGVVLPCTLLRNHNSPYSKLLKPKPIDESLKLYKTLNDFRKQQSTEFLSRTNKSELYSLGGWDQKPKIRVLVTIITTSRNDHNYKISKDDYKPKYLTQTLSKFLRLKKFNTGLKSNISLKIVMCDVDEGSHSELNELSSFTTVHHLYDKPPRSPSQVNSFEKEKRDYASCLNVSTMYSEADYILIVEDDALPHDDLIHHLDHLFAYRVPLLGDFGFIKLFHPSRLNGYITADLNRLVEWFSLASILEHLLTAAVYLWHKSKSSLNFMSRITRYIYFVLLLFAIGRENINYFRRLSPFLYRLVPAPSCCSPALLYSSSSARIMMEHLMSVTSKKGFAKDSVMDLFAHASGLNTWFYEPKLFTHIGVYTTRRSSVVNPLIID